MREMQPHPAVTKSISVEEKSFHRQSVLSNRRFVVWSIVVLASAWNLSNLGSHSSCEYSVGCESVAVRKGNPSSAVQRPFEMPLEGATYRIFQPLFDMDDLDEQLLSSADDFISAFSKRVSWVNTMVSNPPEGGNEEYARSMYLEMIKSFVSALVFGDKELAIRPNLGPSKKMSGPLNPARRNVGADWAYLGDTMTGSVRLNNVRDLISDVITNNVEGGYIETGVWRGGSSIFARAVITAHGQAQNRISYVCDSFAGLPPGDRSLDPKDTNWDNTPYLEVASEIVAGSFNRYGLLDRNVVFAKGFFNETMPPLSKHVEELSVMRLDGDMYESTVDVLYHLYDKLSIGGYVIMDDVSKTGEKSKHLNSCWT
ncbi:hypothetical protein ACHAWX_001713 [Stephanocyclus meneghinianus]